MINQDDDDYVEILNMDEIINSTDIDNIIDQYGLYDKYTKQLADLDILLLSFKILVKTFTTDSPNFEKEYNKVLNDMNDYNTKYRSDK